MSISVKSISKSYGKQLAVNQVSFEINKGEIVGFLGPNGAGKSTVMKMITGFLEPDSGEILVNGISAAENSLKIRELIGYLPENNPLYTDMYIKEYLEFSAGLYPNFKLKKDTISDIIYRTGLEPEKTKKIGALSKGYRQRVGLAQALIHEPDVLILDEPTTGLDPNQIVEIRELIKNIGENRTVMLSTHIMQEVEAICNRILIINNGQIIADNTQGNFNKENKVNNVFVEFNTPINPEALRAFTGAQHIAEISPGTYVVSSEMEAIREKIFGFAVANSKIILTMKQETTNLESFFRTITKA
ncbi:MAG TPA: gliding motility-associated ABC transporter ATP-binding subunit GldA [Bacteroidales bacterium]|nr:gliding motility-associated ABC transporter ATP-binding subunit GldA [Bacteroidales bacterium]